VKGGWDVGSPKRRPTVLLIDRFLEEEQMYAVCFRAAGFDVTALADLHRAVERAVECRADLIVTRIRQPGSDLDGLEVARRLRQNMATRDIPVVIITSMIDRKYREAAAQVGCARYILLPCPLDLLVAQLRDVLAESSSSRKV
jgi:CheY-like chemotaxis protein